ncbi:monocarboxylate transporter 13-like isoform X2 [Lethenteron reissneri]|uniref:monocarboxylate transporter 13-like isoform X2 n=1 Tax=Lethenteron reissneri TaxID=7753 RepID=UPI002AB79FF1|nr:monocarboxylate transporter 13-like isoform X2 [Lethenteron reissneri]
MGRYLCSIPRSEVHEEGAAQRASLSGFFFVCVLLLLSSSQGRTLKPGRLRLRQHGDGARSTESRAPRKRGSSPPLGSYSAARFGSRVRPSQAAWRPTVGTVPLEQRTMGARRLENPPDGGWGWVVVASCFMSTSLTHGVQKSFGVFFVEFIDYFDESRSRTAWINSIMYGVSLFIGPLAVTLSARFSSRSVVMVGGLICGVGTMLGMLAQNITHLYITVGFVTGVGSGIAYTLTNAEVGRYFDKRRAFAAGIGVCGSGASFILAPLFQFLIEQYGWRGSLLLIGGGMLNVCACGAVIRPLYLKSEVVAPSPDAPRRLANIRVALAEQRSHGRADGTGKSADGANDTTVAVAATTRIVLPPEEPDAGLPPTRQPPEEHSPYGRQHSTFRSRLHKLLDPTLFRNEQFTLFLVSNTLFSFGYLIPYVHLAARARELGVGEASGALLLSVIGGVETASRVAAGWLSDFKLVSRFDFYTICVALCALTLFTGPLCRTLPTLLVYAVCFGLFVGSCRSLVMPVAADCVGVARMPSAYGVTLMFQSVGILLGPPAAGWLHDITGNYDMSFYMAGAGLALCVLILLLDPIARRRRRRRWQKEQEPETSSDAFLPCPSSDVYEKPSALP